MTIDIAIIGAGPYGLSIAAQLIARGASVRVFGVPMRSWQQGMPTGMKLKSEGFASSLFSGTSDGSLGQYCASRGTPYADIGMPVELTTFVDYGLAFQQRYVGEIDKRLVASIDRHDDRFLLRLQDEESLIAKRVIVAIGITDFAYMPPQLAALPRELVEHSSRQSPSASYAGRRVAVIGGGSSAIDTAIALHAAGAETTLVARGDQLNIHDKMRLPRPLSDRLRAPMSAIGPSWRSLFYSDAPQLFRLLPSERRLRTVRRHLGPAGGWFAGEQMAEVPTILGSRIEAAQATSSGVSLKLRQGNNEYRTLEVDQVVSATGFKVELSRLSILGYSVLRSLEMEGLTPKLNSDFESSLPGLHFVGTVSANAFGPVMRFVCGARYTAQRLSQHLTATTRSRRSLPAAATQMTGSV